MTKHQLLKFVALRNRSEFSSNMQFEIDANACGFTTKDLGDVKKDNPSPYVCDYVWQTPHGVLRERGGKLSIE